MKYVLLFIGLIILIVLVLKVLVWTLKWAIVVGLIAAAGYVVMKMLGKGQSRQ